MADAYLVETDELYELSKSGSVKIIDTRDEMEYTRGHIANAVNIRDFFTYLCTRGTGGHKGLVKYFAELLGDAGINRQDRVVIYEDALDNGYGQSCRGWFLLKYLGHRDITVLHGGFQAWRARGLPLTSQVSRITPANYIPEIDAKIMVAAEQVLEATQDPAVRIIDCRDYAEWVGANSSPIGFDFCPRKGRIPGAIWLEWYRLMTIKDGIPWFKSNEEILETCAQAGIDVDSTVYIYCFKGARAANTLMAMKIAGVADVRNYFNSWNEWSRDFSLPVDEGYPAILVRN